MEGLFTQDCLTIGGGAGSFSVLSMVFGGGFLGCSVTFSMICWGCRTTRILSMVSPGGVGNRLTHRFTSGAGVGSRILSTFLFGGETLQSFPAGWHPQDIFSTLVSRFELLVFKFSLLFG